MMPAPVSGADAGLREATVERVRSLIEWLQEDAGNIYLLPPPLVARLRAALKAPASGADAGRVLVQEMLDNLNNCSLDSGYCHCGDSMTNHAEPMSCGHTPVDMGWTAARSWVEKAKAFLSKPAALKAHRGAQ